MITTEPPAGVEETKRFKWVFYLCSADVEYGVQKHMLLGHHFILNKYRHNGSYSTRPTYFLYPNKYIKNKWMFRDILDINYLSQVSQYSL